jgi:hypothetical protein
LLRSPELDRLVLQTVERIARIVGATLGFGGSAVLLERQEFGLPKASDANGAGGTGPAVEAFSPM